MIRPLPHFHCRMALLAVLLPALGGCACLHRQNHCRFDDCDYEKATIVYELSGTCGALASTAIRRAYLLQTEPAELSELNEPKRLTWQSALVTIQYPHPSEGECSARATVRLSHRVMRRMPAVAKIRTGRKLMAAVHVVNPKSQIPPEIVERAPQPAAACGSPDEIWTMDLTKQELDLLLCDLSTSGFFGQQWRPSGGGRLYVDVNGCVTRKVWTPEPRLDDLIARVFGEGSLELEVPDGSPAPTQAEPLKPGRVRIVTPPGVLPDPPPPGGASDAPVPGVLPDPPPPGPERPNRTSLKESGGRGAAAVRAQSAAAPPAWHNVSEEEFEAASSRIAGAASADEDWYGAEIDHETEGPVDPVSWESDSHEEPPAEEPEADPSQTLEAESK